jgi:hypothetical protein
MTGTDLCVNKPQSVPVIFEPPCTSIQAVEENIWFDVLRLTKMEVGSEWKMHSCSETFQHILDENVWKIINIWKHVVTFIKSVSFFVILESLTFIHFHQPVCLSLFTVAINLLSFTVLRTIIFLIIIVPTITNLKTQSAIFLHGELPLHFTASLILWQNLGNSWLMTLKYLFYSLSTLTAQCGMIVYTTTSLYMQTSHIKSCDLNAMFRVWVT